MSKRKCNRAVKQVKNLPSCEGLITRKSRKRSRTSDRLFPENGDVSAQEVDSGKTDTHWKNVLNHILQSTDVSSGGGIDDCISDALIYLPSRNVQRPYMTDATKDTPKPKDRYTRHQYKAVTKPETKIHEQADADANKIKCQKIFVNILCSEKFLLLCNLLCEDIKVEKLFDIKNLDSKMKSGVYGQSPGIFFEDLQQIWENFRRVGEEMVILASSLSNMSKDVKCDQQGCTIDSAAKYSDVSITGTRFMRSCDSVPSIKLNHTEVPMLDKFCICKTCGLKVEGKRSLICDKCDAPYHLSCLKPAIKDIPTKSWYCNSCNSSKETTTTQSSEPSNDQTKNDSRNEILHDNCMVCERLELVTEAKEPLIAVANTSLDSSVLIPNTSRESSTSSMVADEAPEISRTALSRLCKRCGTCEDEEKKFLICGHAQCPYKYYHIRCLKTSEIASHQQRNRQCWYCPSCLCRDCFLDKDDESIVLCDGCDEAHHIYCMKPPRTSIPKGQWYCLRCNIEKAKQGMRRYEQWVLQQHGRKKAS